MPKDASSREDQNKTGSRGTEIVLDIINPAELFVDVCASALESLIGERPDIDLPPSSPCTHPPTTVHPPLHLSQFPLLFP